MPANFQILGLAWDEERERHVEEHVATWEVDELIAGQSFLAFPNTKGHPLNRWMVIGRTPAGRHLTVILEQPMRSDPFGWQPITAWPSTSHEVNRYLQARTRQSKKR